MTTHGDLKYVLVALGAALLAATSACSSDEPGADAASAGRGGAGGTGGAASGQAGSGATAGEQGTAGAPAVRGSFLPEFASGSRLSARRYVSDDMPPIFLGFYDSMLETDCTFTSIGGELRCVPTTTPIAREAFFADSSCEQSVGTRPATCGSNSDWYIEQDLPRDACAAGEPHVFHVVALDLGDPLYFEQDGNCVQQAAVGDSLLYYRIEAETPAKDLVAAEAVVLDSSGPLGVRRIDAEDGAELVEGIYDLDAEGLCRVYDEGEAWICVPGVAFHSDGYRNKDADCSQPLSLATCGDPLFLADLDADGNDVFYRVGAAYSGAVYGGVGDTCESVTEDNEGLTYYEVGALVERGDFAPLGVIQEGSGRLWRDVYTDANGTLMMPGGKGVFDSELDAYCSLQRRADGRTFCLPDEIPIESSNNLHYADAACSEQLSHCVDHDCPYDVALQTAPATACGSDFDQVLALGDDYTGTELYIWYSGRPAGMQCDGPFSAADYGSLRRVEGAGTLDAFAELEVVTD